MAFLRLEDTDSVDCHETVALIWDLFQNMFLSKLKAPSTATANARKKGEKERYVDIRSRKM